MRILPILFNTDMVRALLEERKSATRRLVKPHHLLALDSPYHREHPDVPDSIILERLCHPPYIPGDILYVRETFRLVDFNFIDGDWSANVQYWADMAVEERLHYLKHGEDERFGWRPSIRFQVFSFREDGGLHRTGGGG